MSMFVDALLDVPGFDAEPTTCHVRVWDAPSGRVVVIGELTDNPGPHASSMIEVIASLLVPVVGPDPCWVQYLPGPHADAGWFEAVHLEPGPLDRLLRHTDGNTTGTLYGRLGAKDRIMPLELKSHACRQLMTIKLGSAWRPLGNGSVESLEALVGERVRVMDVGSYRATLLGR